MARRSGDDFINRWWLKGSKKKKKKKKRKAKATKRPSSKRSKRTTKRRKKATRRPSSKRTPRRSSKKRATRRGKSGKKKRRRAAPALIGRPTRIRLERDKWYAWRARYEHVPREARDAILEGYRRAGIGAVQHSGRDPLIVEWHAQQRYSVTVTINVERAEPKDFAPDLTLTILRVREVRTPSAERQRAYRPGYTSR